MYSYYNNKSELISTENKTNKQKTPINFHFCYLKLKALVMLQNSVRPYDVSRFSKKIHVREPFLGGEGGIFSNGYEEFFQKSYIYYYGLYYFYMNQQEDN